jgi:hypothetical protein
MKDELRLLSEGTASTPIKCLADPSISHDHCRIRARGYTFAASHSHAFPLFVTLPRPGNGKW